MSENPMSEAPSAEFAAGVAAATAQQAEEQAEEAEATAEVALAVAEGATAAAGDAEETAWSARAAVDELRAELMDRLDAIAADVAAARGPVVDEHQADDAAAAGPPPPEKKDTPSKPEPAEGEKKPGHGMSRRWFGH